MIAKRVPRNKGTSSPARLVRYMVAAQGCLDPRSWARTADYILATKSETAQGERVAGFRVTNCGTDDPAQAAVIIEATQAANTRSKADKTYHMVFSFPPGETPPIDVLHAIEDELCAVIGYTDHQRISAVHVDTDHLHVHVAINKVHPTGLQNIEPFFDKQRLMEACERLEIAHGLQRTNHGLTERKVYDRPERITLGAEQQHGSRFREYLRQSYSLSLAERPEAENYNDLRHLSGSGMAHHARRYTELLPGDARHRMGQEGQAEADSVRWAGHGAGRVGSEDGEGRLGGAAGDMEAHAGVDSLTGYVAREVAPAMRQAASWKQLHAALAEHGLQITPRGAGLVIGDAGLGLWCKASDCGRDLSMKTLTARLGEYEPDGSRTMAERSYTPRPRQPHPSSAGLFAEYQRQRQDALEKRRKGMAAIAADRKAQTEQVRRWAATERMTLKVAARGPIGRGLRAAAKNRATAAYKANAARANERRKALMASTTLPNWNEWLMQRAEGGDVDALAVLRARAEREQKLRGDLLTAERADQARAAILKDLKPRARKDGTLAYWTADGGLVLDRSTHVQAQRATAGAAFVALTLAAERFEGQTLDVRGTDQFRHDVAQLAGLHRVNVVFADPIMEAVKRAATPPTQTPQPTPRPQEKPRQEVKEGPGEAVSAAVLAWVEKRNAARGDLLNIHYNRIWTDADAGVATYQGRRRMSDGSEVLLLQRGDEMLVKPSGPRVVAKASGWRVGQLVELDKRGRFIDTKGQRGERQQ